MQNHHDGLCASTELYIRSPPASLHLHQHSGLIGLDQVYLVSVLNSLTTIMEACPLSGYPIFAASVPWALLAPLGCDDPGKCWTFLF